MVWSGSRPACLPLPFICLPVLFICLPDWVLLIGFPAHFSPRLGVCRRVPSWLVSHFLHLSPTSFRLSPGLGKPPRNPTTSIQPGRQMKRTGRQVKRNGRQMEGSGRQAMGFPAGLSPTSFHLSPTSFHWVPGWVLVVGFPAGLSPTSLHLFPISSYLSPNSFHLSPRLGACSRVSGRLVFVSHFSPSSLLLGVFNSFVRCVRPLCYCWCPPISTGHVAFLFMYLPGLSLLVPALFRWPCSISIHVSPRSVTGGVHPFSLAMRHLYSFVSQCHCWCPPSSLAMRRLYSFVSQFCHPSSVTAGVRPFLSPRSVTAALFRWPCGISIHLPGLSLLVSTLLRRQCSISVHLSFRSVTGGVRLVRWP